MDILINDLSKSYQNKLALKNINLKFPAGSFTAILGPSGCGKTTLMRCLAGFLPVNSGSISFGELDVTNFPPQKRGTAMVFQDYALWPHMTVYENIAYGLKLRKCEKNEMERKIFKILDMVEIETNDVKKRHPGQYSGGQQQRIALARALVLEPKLLLMDEPLSNLDAKVRQRLRVEICRIQKELGITAVYVTHDQDEALSMADQVVLMNEGVVEQVGPPERIYQQPGSYFAAQFIGMSNSLNVAYRDGTYYLGEQSLRLQMSELPKGNSNFVMVIRSRDVQIAKQHTLSDEYISFRGNLRESRFTGSGFRHWVEAEKQDIFIDSEENIPDKGLCYVQIPREKCFLYLKEAAS